MGRPLTLDDDKIEAIRTFLASGAFVDEAAEAAGVGKRTAERWRQKGEAARAKEDAGEDLTDDEALYKRFYDACREARAQAVVNAHARIRAAMPKSWRAAAWYLVVCDPERYASRTHRTDSAMPTPEQVARLAVEQGDADERDVAGIVTILGDYMERRRRERGESVAPGEVSDLLADEGGER